MKMTGFKSFESHADGKLHVTLIGLDADGLLWSHRFSLSDLAFADRIEADWKRIPMPGEEPAEGAPEEDE